ncbi:hypothetical protein C6499_12330 [Candidatus Poribacteria bacterium]|nr:MAG: hypothetical protein C6499_12330 [Candidatus Poribacteria bacterium]
MSFPFACYALKITIFNHFTEFHFFVKRVIGYRLLVFSTIFLRKIFQFSVIGNRLNQDFQGSRIDRIRKTIGLIHGDFCVLTADG